MITCPKCKYPLMRLFLDRHKDVSRLFRIGVHCGQCRALYHYNVPFQKVAENMREEPNPPQGDPTP